MPGISTNDIGHGPQRPRAIGLPTLPNRPCVCPLRRCAQGALCEPPHAAPIPSCAFYPPVPSATAVPPIAADVAAAGHSAPAAPGAASASPAPAEAGAVARPQRCSGHRNASRTLIPRTQSLRTPVLLPPPTPAAPPARHGSRRAPSAIPSAVTSSCTSRGGQGCWTCARHTPLRPLSNASSCVCRRSLGDNGVCRSQR